MGESFGSKVRQWLGHFGTGAKIVFGAAAALVFIIWGALNRRRAEKQGEDIGRLEEAKDRLNEAEKQGNDVAVLEEFRRQTRRKK